MIVSMSTTHTTCPGCLSSDLGVVFGHDCQDDIRNFLRSREGVRLTPADSVDLRPAAPAGAGRRQPRRTDTPNRYEGECGRCGATVKAGQGRIEKVAGRWKAFHLGACPVDQPAAAAERRAAPAPQPCRPNRYAADCDSCGRHVPAEAGQLCKQDGRWLVTCVGGCKPADEVDAGPAHQAPQVDAGHYAIPSTGENDLVFYRVDRPTKGTYAGRTFVKMIVGGHPDRNVRRSAVAGILERIAADPDAAARYGRELGRCCRCNRHLTDETSRSAGIGPECAKVGA